MDKEKQKLKLGDILGDTTPDNIEDIESIATNNDLLSFLVVNQILNPDNLQVSSRLKKEQIPTLTKLYLFSETFNNKFIKSLADTILRLQISHNGLGRRELIQIIQQRNDLVQDYEPKQKKGIFR